MPLIRYGTGKVTGEVKQTTDKNGNKKLATVPLKSKKDKGNGNGK